MPNYNFPLVSIVVPSYNYEAFIEAALSSIFEQTYQEIELIIVDDNSKDNSCKIIDRLVSSKEYKDRFNGRLEFVQHDVNLGAHNSINEGIKLSKGEYITILNADDLFQTNRISELMSSLIDTDSELAFSRISVIDSEGKDISGDSELAANFVNIQNSIAGFPSVGWSLVPHNTAISTGNMLFSRILFNKLNGFRNLKYCHDWDFVLRALLLTEPVFVESTYYYYRLHGNNTFLKLNDVVDREVRVVLGHYFKKCRGKDVLNKLAPSPKNWDNVFFEVLNNSSLTKFWSFSKSPINLFVQFQQFMLDQRDKR